MKVTFVQCEIPAYRQGVFDLLSERLPAQLTLVAGGDYFDHHGRVQIEHPALRAADNHYLGGRRVLWQTGIWRPALGADVTVIELNPRILSNWVILIARRILRRRTIVWGHAFPRGGSERATDRLRHIMRRLASGVVVYTHQQAEALRQLMPNASVTAAPNALYSTRDHPLVPRNADQAVNVVYVGRLIEVKKPELLLEAFAAVVDELPPAMNLMFVGEGTLRSSLEESAAKAGISDRVRFHGEVIEYDDLAEVYASALVNACPGYAGLSITQSYWFGVPTVIARDDPHSPEIEAAAEGFNTVFFESDSADDLGRALVRVADTSDEWIARGAAIATNCADNYSLEAMVDAMIGAVVGDATPHPHGSR
jgi:glycosyltransferase involved in cell wall biosynthesis